MRRFLSAASLTVLLALPPAAMAADGTALFAGIASAAPQHQLTGKVVALDLSTVTVQTGGRVMGRINAMVAAANALTRANYAYVWGGGHAEAGVPSIGESGPGFNGRRHGFDCSGSVAAVLAAAGLWTPGSGVPADNGVIDQLRSEGLIVRGAANTPNQVNLYDDPGVHIFMSINGRFFGTSDGGGQSGSPAGGPGWISDGAPDASSRAYRQYHFRPGVLHDSTSYGHDYTFETGLDPSVLNGFLTGDKVTVGYSIAGGGRMIARSLGFFGARTATGLLSAVSTDRSSFSVLTPAGRTVTFATGRLGPVSSSTPLGESVSVTYTAERGANTARGVSVLAAPTVVSAAGTITQIAAGGRSLVVTPASGAALTLSVPPSLTLPTSLSAGTPVNVQYVAIGQTLVLSYLTAASAPAGPAGPAGATGTTGTTGSTGPAGNTGGDGGSGNWLYPSGR